jgi:hypothetical protein
MSDCIDCGKEIPQTPDGVTICIACVHRRYEQLTPDQRLAMAKVGLDAVIDEVTGKQKTRPKGELKQRYEKYLKEGKDGKRV